MSIFVISPCPCGKEGCASVMAESERISFAVFGQSKQQNLADAAKIAAAIQMLESEGATQAPGSSH